MKRPVEMCATLVCLVSVAVSSLAPARDAPISGSPGGGGQPLRRECPEREYVIGIYGSTGQWVDGIQIVCAQVNEAGTFFAWHALDGIGSFNPASSRYVGCPNWPFGPNKYGDSVVLGLSYGLTRLDDNRNGFVDFVNLSCSFVKVPSERLSGPSPELVSAGGDQNFCRKELNSWGVPFDRKCGSHNALLTSTCATGEFVTGVYGRAGMFIDVLGVICSPAPILKPGHSDLGRGKVVSPPYGTTSVATAKTPYNRAVVGRPGQTATAGTQLPGAAAANGESLPSLNRPLSSRASIGGNRVGLPASREQVFAPPQFADGARLWACDGGADQACDGRAAANAWCTSQGFSSSMSSARPTLFERAAAPARSVSGESCEATSCPTIESVTCAR